MSRRDRLPLRLRVRLRLRRLRLLRFRSLLSLLGGIVTSNVTSPLSAGAGSASALSCGACGSSALIAMAAE